MFPYGFARTSQYKATQSFQQTDEPKPKHAPRGVNSTKRKTARQDAKSLIQSELLH